jgi:Predicted Zn peptidase
MTHSKIEDATDQYNLEDGYTVKELRPGLNLILYNENRYSPRMRFTILHEIGHIRLNHKKDGSQEEIEANFFASQAIAPNIVLREILNRGYPLTQSLLTSAFWISKECANKKMNYLGRYPEIHSNELDSAILKEFNLCLRLNTPYKYNINLEVD